MNALDVLDRAMRQITRQYTDQFLRPMTTRQIKRASDGFGILNRARCYLMREATGGHCICGEHGNPMYPARIELSGATPRSNAATLASR